MKKLEKLKLHDFDEICVDEQKSMKGGGEWVWGGDRYYLYPGETVVIASRYSLWGPGSVFGINNWDYCGSAYEARKEFNSLFFLNGNYSAYNFGGGGAGGGSSSWTSNSALAVSPSGLSFLQSWEKLSRTAYDDNGSKPGGFMTIGWGHKIKDYEDFSAGITEEQANIIFQNDLATAINDVINTVRAPLSQAQFDALVSYSFNIGGLRASPNCLALLNSLDYAGAAAEMDIVMSDGVVLNGLIERRENEREIFINGTYINHN